MPEKFDINALMEFNNNKVTDHNRQPLSVTVERIESPKRMANGTRRKYVVADKRTFSTSWNELPSSATYTVDGFWGGEELENFYNNNAGEFTLKLTYGDKTQKSFRVMFTSFRKTLSKRGLYDFWELNIEMEEV